VSDPPPDLLEQAWLRDRNVADTVATGGHRIWRRLLWRVGVVLALLVVIDVVLAAALPPVELLPDTQMEAAVYTVKVDRFAAAPAPDVLFFGSSRVRDGIVPSVAKEELEEYWGRPVRAYNLGLPNATLEEYRALVGSHLPDPAPRFVVLGLSGTEVVAPDDFQYASRFLWQWPQFSSWLGNVSWKGFQVAHVENYVESVLARHWYLFGQRDALRTRLLRALGLESRPDLATDPSAPGADVMAGILSDDGFTHRPEFSNLAQRLKNDPEAVRLPAREREFPAELVQGSRFDKLREVVAVLRAKGCRVALAEVPPSPYLQQLNPVLHGPGLPAKGARPAQPGFRERMAALADELDMPFVPCDAQASGLGNEVYLDVNHLNEAGARRYTRLLVKSLIEAGFFAP
jgi:hypothetical protein